MICLQDLSAPSQRLLRLFQTINFGRVEELEIRNGEPRFSPAPRVLVELKLDREDGPRAERQLGQFQLLEPPAIPARFTQPMESAANLHAGLDAGRSAVLALWNLQLFPRIPFFNDFAVNNASDIDAQHRDGLSRFA